MIIVVASLSTLLAVALWAHGSMAAEMRALLLVMDESEEMGISEWTGPQLARALSEGRSDRGPYASLHALEDDGLVTSREEPGSGTPERGGIPRRLYSITSQGRFVARRKA